MEANSLTGVTILIADDEPDNFIPLTKMLTHLGVAVVHAEDGESGLRKIENGLMPDLVLLDLSMPGMDGWAMLKHLRANPRTRNLKVVAVTAHAMLQDRERALNAGFDGYITKPFRPSRILGAIKSFLPVKQTA